jgi:YebC/PmpR family DNA-binding regulatory protein
MSGHSKWSQIKRSKGAKDAKRGVLFSKLSKKITIAAKSGGSDPALNFQLRTEIENARAEGMPNDNIDRAIKKATDKDAASISEAIYEGYGPFGTAFLVEVAADNTNRSVQNIKHIFSKHGGSLGAMGSVAWQFETKGQILVERPNVGASFSRPQDKTGGQGQPLLSELELIAIDAGAEDVRESEEGLEIYTKPQHLQAIKQALETAGATIAQAHIIKESSQGVDLTEEQKPKVDALFAELEENEDVVAVHTSANL